jgi:hypothetical protein
MSYPGFIISLLHQSMVSTHFSILFCLCSIIITQFRPSCVALVFFIRPIFIQLPCVSPRSSMPRSKPLQFKQLLPRFTRTNNSFPDVTCQRWTSSKMSWSTSGCFKAILSRGGQLISMEVTISTVMVEGDCGQGIVTVEVDLKHEKLYCLS